MALLDHWPTERRSLRDPTTGTPVEQWTTRAAHHWPLPAPDTPFTPTGESLLFLSDRAGAPHLNLFRLDFRTGEIEQVTDTDRLDPSSITPSARGKQAIASLRGEDGEVVAMDLETGEWETLAVFLGAELDGCHRSASGEYIITVVNQGEEGTLTAVHTEGMRTVPILTGPRGVTAARFSPDSKNSVLYVTPSPAGIRCVEFDGSRDRELYSGAPTYSVSRIPYPAKSEAGPPLSNTEYAIRTAIDRLNACPPTWLGSGEELLFLAGAEAGQLTAVPRAGGPARAISPLICRWARSDASGRQIVALASSLDRDLLVLIDPRSGDEWPLCTGRSAEPRPCFSPDGRVVVYADRDEHGYSQLFAAYPSDNNRPGALPVVDLEPRGA